MEGFVYIMSNKSMPEIYKIGYTTRHPTLRAEELSTTGVPSKFIVEFYIYVEDCIKVESNCHDNLKKFNYGKEFFKVDLTDCIIEVKNIVKNLYGNNFYESYSSSRLKSDVEFKINSFQRTIVIDKFTYIYR